ncbi:histidine kinase [uncultured Fibrella sp.]|uniref:histidine kinase n=1 Tax=uncultured Fibrella sp. TaxID=1284596 RepID=UPI0035CC9561
MSRLLQRCLVIGLLWLNSLLAWGQPASVQPGNVPAPPPVMLDGTPPLTRPIDMTPYLRCYADTTGLSLPFAVIQQQPFLPFTRKPLDKVTPSPTSKIVLWLMFRVQNSSATRAADVLLNVGRQGQIDAYSEQGRHLQQTGTYFFAYNTQQWQPIRVHVAPQQTATYFIKITNLVRVVDPITVTLHTRESLQLWFAANSHVIRWLFLGLALVSGGLFVMSFFTFAQYCFNRDRVFLYYAIFCFSTFFLILWNLNYRMGLALPLPLPMRSTNQLFTFIIAFFYLLFISHLIELPTHFPRTWAVLRWFLVVFVLQGCLGLYEYWYGLIFRQNWYYLRQEGTFLIAGIILFISLLRSKSPVRGYLISGIVSLWVVSYFHMFMDIRFRLEGGDPALQIFANYVPFFFSLGALVECFFFLLALAYRNRLVELERNQIQNQYTNQLETQLGIRTQEIELKNKLLEAQRIKQLKTDFDQRIADSEMTALRAQMNPHFIFNCLNSIKLYTLQNDTDKASDYLTKFARLIRLVLENSRSELVPLHNELDALQLYIDLEAMRFKAKVNIRILVDPTIDRQFIHIPPLLLQPYVENAIWHGLMHKPEGGNVTINVTQPTDQCLHIDITDDGIGRLRAAELKSKSAGHNKSFGMQVTADRIRMINQLYHTHTKAQVLDLIALNGDPLGTKVILEIPI